MNLKSFYRTHKDSILLGPFLKLGKFFYGLPYIQNKIRQRRIFSEVKFIFGQIYKDIPVKRYIKEFKAKKLGHNKFSLGHADDFDVLMLYLFTRVKRPMTIVETGVASGRSSSAILEALNENKTGELFSIDLPKFYDGMPEMYVTEDGRVEHKGFVPKGKESGWLVPQNLRKQWHLTLGDSRRELPTLLAKLKEVDIFYHDSDHSYESMMFEFETVWPYIPKGGILLADDARGNDAFNNFVREVNPQFHYVYDGLGIILK